MFRRIFGIALGICLTMTGTTFAQREFQDVDLLLKQGSELLDGLPEIPTDLDTDYYYKIEANDKPIGWQHIKLDTTTKEGDRFYRYRARYGYNGVNVGFREGEMMVIMDRRWKPIEVRNKMESITPEGGKRDVKDRARIKHDKFQRRLFDGRQTKKVKFEYADINAVYFPEPLVGNLKLDPGKRFAMVDYDVQRGMFDTRVYEVDEKKKDGMTRVRTYWVTSVEDPSKMEDVEIVANAPHPLNEDPNARKDKDETEEEKQAKEPYILIDDDKSIRFINIPQFKMTVRRIDRERLEEVKKALIIKAEDIPTT
jgi:hypothetical protein